MYKLWWNAYIRVFWKILQESYHLGQAILKWYVPVWILSVQNDWFLYNSIVHPYYKGCTYEYVLVYLKAVLVSHYDIPCSWYQPRWTMYRQVYHLYNQESAIYIQCTNSSIHYWIHYFSTYNIQICIYEDIHVLNCIHMHISVHICSDNVYNTYLVGK
jgi:hypothetical protein